MGPKPEARSPRRLCLLLGVTLVGLLPSVARAQAANVVPYEINFDSFGSTFGGVSPERVLEYGGETWVSQVGTGRLFVPTGSTTWTKDCGVGGPNRVVAHSGCMGGNCNVIADYFNCLVDGWIVTFWLGTTGGLSLTPTPLQRDVQSTIQHELGHDAGGHINSDTCVMNADTGAVAQRFYCRDEIKTYRTSSHFSFSMPSMNVLTSSTWPDPAVGSWSDSNLGSISGVGFLDLGRGRTPPGAIVNDVFVTDTSGSLYSSPYPSFSWDAVGETALMRPTVAYDPTRRHWWLFWRPDDASLRNDVEYSEVSDPGGTWTVPNVVTGTNGDPIVTRLPVAATYDYYSDRIVVAFVFWGPWAAASGEMEIVSIPAGAPAGTWSDTVTLSGATSVGPMAIACENSTWQCNCQGVNSGTDADRRLWDFGFGLNPDGTLYKQCGYGTSGYQTDFPPGLTSGGQGATGYFVTAIHGLDGRIDVRSKQHAWDAWGPWHQVGTTGASGTPVRVSDYAGNYQVLHAPAP